MKLPLNSHISKERLTDYLLKPSQENDKSKFLAMGGFYPANWEELYVEIMNLLELDAEPAQSSEFGQFF